MPEKKKVKTTLIYTIVILIVMGGFWFFSSLKGNKLCLLGAKEFRFENSSRIELQREPFSCFLLFSDKANNEDILRLMYSENSVTQAYGFWAKLNRTEKDDVLGLLKSKLHDNDSVRVRTGSIVFTSSLGMLYLDLAFDSLNSKEKLELMNYIDSNNFDHIDQKIFYNKRGPN